MTHPVAVLSILPDAGHVFPLLRVAASLSERGHDVVCYLPQECEKYLNGYDFRFVSLGPAFSETAKDTYRDMLLRLSKKSIFYNAFAGSVDLSEGYWDPLISEARLASVKSHLATERPLLLLCDDHVFKELYASLSTDLDIPLVLHTFEGHRRHQNLYVYTYGISSLPPYLALGLGYAMHAASACVIAFVRLGRGKSGLFHFQRHFDRFSGSLLRWLYPDRVEEHEARESTDPMTPNPSDDETYCGTHRRPIAISTGAGYLEQTYLKSELDTRDEHRFFGPLRPRSVLQLSSELREWLDDDFVVYVSFGSMIHLDLGFVKAILAGLSMLNVRALWSMPKPQQDELLPNLDIPESVRFCEFVPPLEVLSMKSVRCGINHGGAGSVQDCLLSGKPMLVIPVMWDQPFNGSVVSRLGVGKRLWRRRVSAKAVAGAVEPLIYDDQFSSRAANIAAELQRRDSEAEVVKYILDQVAMMTRSRAASAAC